MKLLVVFGVFCACLTSGSAQKSVSEAATAVSAGLWKFSMELLAKTASAAGDINIIISPHSIWSLMAILNEGAAGKTRTELEEGLRIPADGGTFRLGYKLIGNALAARSEGIELDIANAIFTDKESQLLKDFQYQVYSQYKGNVLPVNFRDVDKTIELIDSFVANATRNRLTKLITADDLSAARMLLTTAVYFKGQWTVPFNRSATALEMFHDENMNPVGRVPMMYQMSPYSYLMLPDMQGHAVELPYGKDGTHAMIVILPKKNLPLSTLLRRLSEMPAHQLMRDLDQAREDFYDEDVQVYLPRFSISTDFVLNVILTQMGIVNVFDSKHADLSRMSRDNLFLTRVIHKAEIEVNEEGTVASAVSGGLIANRSPSPKFIANRPFAYLIVEKSTKTVLFAGKVSQPETDGSARQ